MDSSRIEEYLINKFMGGNSNGLPPKNIKFELEDGFEFGEIKVAGKTAFGIRKCKK